MRPQLQQNPVSLGGIPLLALQSLAQRTANWRNAGITQNGDPYMRLNVSILVGLLLGTGCQLSTEPDADVLVVTSVAASGNGAVPFKISTTITNESNRAVTFSTETCPSRFRVETVTGVVIKYPDQICSADARSTTLAPGERFQLGEQWNGKGADGVQLIGTYRVVGQPFLTVGPQSEPVTVELPR